jgi:general stress protein 26
MILIPQNVYSQDKIIDPDSLKIAARDLMETARYCALITLDSTGHPQARAMDAFKPDEDMNVWLGTNQKSRKVEQIRNDHRVTLYYADPGGGGYVTVIGRALLVNDLQEKSQHWKEEWQDFYKNRREDYLLIKVIPIRLDIISYKHGITGDPVTWRAAAIEFETTKSTRQ